MLGLYFSGTGNTKYCVEQFLMNFDGNNAAVSIETEDVCKIAGGHDTIIFGHPVCFSNTPKIVHDFIVNNGNIFKGKKIFIIATMGLFSGDGAGCSARLF
ncbi:MAG: iron-sulfur protein, partial [Treponema sp.]|nr:iron-sulfur protein [Treponema sp.]